MSTLCLKVNHADLGTARERVMELIREVLDQVEEIAESDVDSHYFSGPIPGGNLGDRIAELECQLKLLFTSERDERQVKMASFDAPPDMGATANLDAAHDILLAQINRVVELTGSPLRPASTWTDIESSLRRFVAQLDDHEAHEDGLLKIITAAPAVTLH